MAMFQDPNRVPKPKVPKPTPLERVKKDLLKAADEWLENNFYNHGGYDPDLVKDYVARTLGEFFRGLLLTSAGINRSFDSYEVRYDSPLKTLLAEMAQRQAVLWFDEYFKNSEDVATLPKHFRAAIVKRYKESYDDQLRTLARDRGREDATKDFEAMVSTLVGLKDEEEEETK